MREKLPLPIVAPSSHGVGSLQKVRCIRPPVEEICELDTHCSKDPGKSPTTYSDLGWYYRCLEPLLVRNNDAGVKTIHTVFVEYCLSA